MTREPRNTEPLTDDQILRALRRLGKRWPDNRQLFAWNGSLVLMDEDLRGKGTYEEAVIGHAPGIQCDGGEPDYEEIYGEFR